MLKIICSIVLIFAVGACVPQQKPPVYIYGVQNQTGAGVHAVRAGDSLSAISKRYDLSQEQIITSNDLTPPYTLRIGQRLFLPPPETYTVQEGDSLYTVSRVFAVDTYTLAQTNALRSPFRLSQGQVLRIPFKTGAQKAAFRDQLQPQNTIRPSSKPIPKTIQKRIATSKPPKRSGRFVKPVNGSVISSYGPKGNGIHNDGINIKAPKGTFVGAAENGIVVYTGDQIAGQGNLILIRHQGGYVSAYSHLESISVAKGDVVKAGQHIGRVGNSGNVTTPQLHFEIRQGTKAINPSKFI